MASEREINQYLEAVLWLETDENQEPLDRNYGIEDFTQAARNQARVELNEFEVEMDRVLKALGDEADDLDLSSWPHDFWLSRSGSGSGFIDREKERYGNAAKALHALARRVGEINVVVDEYDEGVELSFFPCLYG